jgi:hypothetical protein
MVQEGLIMPQNAPEGRRHRNLQARPARSGHPPRAAKRRRRPRLRDQRGAIIVVAALCLMMILGIAGLAVDLGYLDVVRCELQRAADAGAMAGAQSIYPCPLSSAALPLAPRCDSALAKGREIAQANLVDGVSPTVATIQTGAWDWNTGRFAPGCSACPFTNAVALTTRRDNLSLYFMSLLGFGPLNFQASSVAVMDWVGRLPPETIPVAINKDSIVFNPATNFDIRFASDPVDNGGWFVPSGYSANANALKNFINQNPPMPAVQMGDTINLNNGTVASALKALGSQLASHNNNWQVWLPVVATCKFNHSDNIGGFVGFSITQVQATGNPKYIRGKIMALSTAPGAGPNGANLNLLIPVKLVN